MKDRNLLIYLVLLIAQIILNNFVNFTPYFVLSILPVMVMMIPPTVGSVRSLLLAFAMGFAVDFLSDGALGLTIVALLPVAALRRGIISVVFGEDVIVRGDRISVSRQGLGKVVMAILMALGLYLAVYIVVDGAGTRSLVFNAIRWAVSLAGGTLVSIIVVGLFSRGDKWR